MPETLTQTVEVPIERVVEAAATLLRTAELELAGGSETDMGNAAEAAAFELLGAAIGPHDDEELWTHPLVVEAQARAYERLAETVERQGYRQMARDVRKRQDAH